jgi:hypothetical protein
MVMNLDITLELIAEVRKKAKEIGIPMVIAVVAVFPWSSQLWIPQAT